MKSIIICTTNITLAVIRKKHIANSKKVTVMRRYTHVSLLDHDLMQKKKKSFEVSKLPAL